MRTLLTLGLTVGLFATPASAQEQKPQDSLASLLADLKQTGDANRRLQAATRLADLGPRAEPAVPALMAALESEPSDEDLRLNAAIALGKIGKAAVAPLQTKLGHADKDVRFYVSWALGWVGPDARPAAPALVKAMADKDEGVRRKVAYALGRIHADPQQALTVLLAALKDPSEDVRQAAGDAAAKFGTAAVPGLTAALQDADPVVRVQAAKALAELGTDAQGAEPRLRELLLGKEENQAHVFAHALAKLGKPGVPALIAGLKDDRATLRQVCMASLQEAGAVAVPALVDALGDRNVAVRRAAAQVLMPLRVGDKMVVTALAYALKNDTDDQVRQLCVSALQYLGVAGKAAAPALQHALADASDQVRRQAYYALQNMGENPRQGLLQALASKDDTTRVNTAALMLQVGVEPNQALPVLTAALKHDSDALRMQAAFALAQSRREADKLLPFFTAGLQSTTPRVRQQALQGLQYLGPQAQAAVPQVVAALRDSQSEVRQQALHTLQSMRGDLSPHADEIIAALKTSENKVQVIPLLVRAGEKGAAQLAQLLRDPNDGVRWQAILTLQNQTRQLPGLVPVLVESLHDKNPNVRMYAAYALARAGDAGGKALATAFAQSKEAATRQQIVQALFAYRNRTESLPVLRLALKDPDRQVRITALQYVPNLGQTQEVLDILTNAVKDEQPDVSVTAVYALQRFGVKGMPVLEQRLPAAKDSRLRQALLQGLLNYNHRARTMVGPLTEYLKDTTPQVRWQAAQVLGNIGPDAKDAVPALRTLLNDGNPTVRQLAQGALNRIEGGKR